MLGELQPGFPGSPLLDCFCRDMDELLDRFLGEKRYRNQSGRMPTLPAEGCFKERSWPMRFDLPGVQPKDIDVSVAGDTLTIRDIARTPRRRAESSIPDA